MEGAASAWAAAQSVSASDDPQCREALGKRQQSSESSAEKTQAATAAVRTLEEQLDGLTTALAMSEQGLDLCTVGQVVANEGMQGHGSESEQDLENEHEESILPQPEAVMRCSRPLHCLNEVPLVAFANMRDLSQNGRVWASHQSQPMMVWVAKVHRWSGEPWELTTAGSTQNVWLTFDGDRLPSNVRFQEIYYFS